MGADRRQAHPPRDDRSAHRGDPALNDFRHFFSERLELRALSLADLDEVYALMSDPRVWRHLPSGVHTSAEQSAAQLEREDQGWELDGLGYWSAHLREGGAFAGVGGCRLHAGAVWNLYYRIRPELQGNGYATELARAAIDAAHTVDPAFPIVASVLAHNAASRGVATAVGLRLVWQSDDARLGDGAGRSEETGQRLVFCDRDLDGALRDTLHLD